MSKFFTLRKILLACILGTGMFAQAQTNPVPQPLPFTQNFSGFNGSVTTYPAGFQGWGFGTASLAVTYNVNPATADQALGAMTNASTSAIVGDMNGKIGILSTGSAIRALALALNTSNFTSITVSFTAATQRQQVANRVDELGLQYRIGTSGTFTNVASSTYQNNVAADNIAGTGAVNPTSISITLPAACNNQPIVQLRWIIRDATGSGNRPSFSVDDIVVNGTSTTPGTTSISPNSIAAGSSAFTLTVNGSNFISGSSNVTWNGATRTTTFLSVNQLSASIPASDIATAGTATVGVTTTGAPASSNTQTFTINAAATPSLITSPLASYGSLCINTTPVVNSFTLNGNNLDGTNLSIASLNGFTYSETTGGTYTSTLNFSYSGGAISNKVIYVKFTPAAAQVYDGNIILSGGGLSSNVSVPASATGINTPPTVATGTNVVGGTSVTMNGSITANGCATISSYGFEYSTTSGFAGGTGIPVTAANINSGAFSKTVSGLTGATTYYYKAFATTASGTFYGSESSFATSSVVPVVMSAQPLLRYTENFSDINNWSANFASGIGANHFSSVGVSGTAAIPNPTRTTTSTAAFSSGTSGGVQKGTGTIVLLSTGSSPENSTSAAIDFYMDFTGVNAGTLSFDWASVNNSTGDRNGSLRVYGSTDGITFTEITTADVLNFTNNVPTTGTVNTVALPASFNGSPTARLRFYYSNGTGGTSGSRPKISIDNLTVTAIPSSPCATPAANPTSLNFDAITETSIHGTFVAASPAANEYLVIMSSNSSLTSNPIDGQTYVIGDNVGDGTVIAKGSDLSFTATDLTGATTYFFFVFPVNSVCTGGPKYLTSDPLTDDETTVAGLPSCTAPAAQATGLTTTASINTVQGSFTATAADEYIVLQSTNATFSGVLSNATVYNAGATVGNATVVQRSNATSFTASGLNPATQYYYFIFSINSQGCLNGPVYNTASPLTGTATTLPLPACTTPTAQPSDISFNASNNSVTATFNGAGSNLNYLVVMSASPTLSATPVDNTDYVAGSALGGGTVVSNSTGTSFIATNLSAANTYYFFVFAANKNCTGGTKYLVTSPLSGNATTTNEPVNNYYFGNLHSHSDYSDGNKDHPGYTPADDYNYALGSMGMDFLGISEHNHFSSVDNPGNEIANYHMGTTQAAAFNAAHTNFLALYGMEWGVISGGGHVVVYGDNMNDLFGWESNVNGHVGPNYDVYVPKSTYIGPDGLFKTVNDYIAKNTFATLAHPNNTDYNNLSNIDYDPVADSAITGVAVESGPATSSNTTYSNPGSSMFYLWYFQKLLAKGYHLGPTIDHDNHNTTFGRTTPARLGVIAPALTQSDIIKAVRDMHFYATEDMDAKVDFTINTRIMGSIFEDRNAPSIAVNLTDATTNTSNALIRVMSGIPGSGINAVVIDSVFGSSLSYVDNALANHATGYYYIDITNNGSRIITSPIWYTRTCAAASDTTANVCGSFNWYGTVYATSTVAVKTFTTTGGCDSTVTLHLNISNPPASATIALVGSDTGCPGTGVALTAAAADGGNGAIVSYQWFTNGVLSATTATTSYTALTSGAYTVAVTNAGGCSVTGSNSVNTTVTDNTAPVPDAASLSTVTGECSATVTTVPTATDACAGTVTGTTNDPLVYNTQGTYTITWAYNDGNGNTSIQTQTVILSDHTAPVPDAASLSTVTGECSATVTTVPTATDACAGTVTGTTNDPLTYNTQGTYTITWTFNDNNGNTSTQTQTVIVHDQTAPVLAGVPASVSVSCDAIPAAAVVTATDNCSTPVVTLTETSTQNADVNDAAHYQYTLTRIWTATDAANNSSTALQVITVSDTQAPVINSINNITQNNDAGTCGAVVNFAVTASDNCSPVNITYSSAPGSVFSVGTTTVTATVKDVSGNTATADFTVTVVDNEKPSITAPMTYSVPNDAGQCGATIAGIGTPVVSDNCGVVTVTNDHPSHFYPVGTTIVTWTATDMHGNVTDTAKQSITVMDNELPTISVINVNANNTATLCGANLTLTPPVTADNCGVASVTNNHPSAFFAVGTTNVTWTVRDNNGWTNTAVQTVTVTDTELPIIATPSAVSVSSDAGQCTATIVLTAPATSDNCGVASVTNDHPSNIYPTGTTAVTWTVTDTHGLTATATQNVTVTDTQPPVVYAQPVTVYLNASGIATVTAAQVNNGSTDNCGIGSMSLSKTNFTCANLGTNTITLTVTDINGNTASANTTVTVKDNTLPTVLTQAVTVYLNAAGVVTITAAQINNGSSDNCGISSMSLSKTNFTCANLGSNTVNLTVTDASGNTANANAMVTVKDNIVPTVITQPVTVYLSASGVATVTAAQVNNGSTDNCGISSMGLSKTNFTCADLGANTVSLTVTDASGNTANANATVTVKDNTAPVVITQPVTVYLNASGVATVTAAQVNNGSTDNCGISSMSLNKTSFTCANLGANTVSLTVTDAGGNATSANAIITVKDNLAPAIVTVANQTFCSSVGSYTIPVLTATDNCSAVIISYTITGATTRSGTGANASGVFNTGVSTINWTVKDASGNIANSATTVTISALPAVVITASGADVFCNKLTLTASSAVTGAAYKWTTGSSTFATTQTISLGQSNGDGIYQVTATINGCTSAPSTYTYQKQNLVSSYTILAYDGINLGSNNTVASGSVGITDAKGDLQIIGSNTSISSPGSFVKAKYIDKFGFNISIANPINSAATGITLPTMLLNTASMNGLPNKEVAQGTTATVSGNYKSLTIHKNARATITGTVFGTIRVEQGAQVTFTAATINIEDLQVVKGPRNGYSYVRFSGDANVLVSDKVSIGSQVYINPDNNKVTFYMGDKKSDDEKFTVNGGDTKVTANIYVPNGTLKVTGGYSYGFYGLFGLGDCDRDDDENQYFGLGNSYVNMTGSFIAENVIGYGKNVIWNSFDCSAAPVPVLNSNTPVITDAAATKENATASEEELKITVMPNPTTTFFTLKLESKFETPVNLRVMDAQGRVVDAKSQIGSNSTLQIGHAYASGTYYAEFIQGGQRKVVQLVKGRG